MPLRVIKSLNPFQPYDGKSVVVKEEVEHLFNPEAGKASENPFAHLQSDESPGMADSNTSVSKYVGGEKE